MYKKSKNIIFIMLLAIPQSLSCSDIRDYYPKKGETLDPLANFRAIKTLERKAKISECKVQSLQTDLAQARIKIASQENHIKLHDKRISNLEQSMAQAHNSIEDNAINLEIVTENVNDLRNESGVLTEHAKEIENIQDGLSALQDTVKNNFDELRDELYNEIDDLENKFDKLRMESSPFQNKKRPRSLETSPYSNYKSLKTSPIVPNSKALSPVQEYEYNYYQHHSPYVQNGTTLLRNDISDHDDEGRQKTSSCMKALLEAASSNKKSKL